MAFTGIFCFQGEKTLLSGAETMKKKNNPGTLVPMGVLSTSQINRRFRDPQTGDKTCPQRKLGNPYVKKYTKRFLI